MSVQLPGLPEPDTGEVFFAPAIPGCRFVDPDDQCCGHPDNMTPECWLGSLGSTCCPIIEHWNQHRATRLATVGRPA